MTLHTQTIFYEITNWFHFPYKEGAEPGFFPPEYEQEIKKARLRVGLTVGEQIDWFLKFSQCDLLDLSKGQLTDLAYEINWWVDAKEVNQIEFDDPELVIPECWECSLSRLNWGGKARFHDKGKDWMGSIFRTVKAPKFLPLEILSAKKMRILQKQFSPILQGLPYDLLDLTIPGFRHFNIRNLDTQEALTITVTESPLDQMQRKLGSLLINHENRVRICAGCNTTFHASRLNMVYCSTRCQTTVATRKFREAQKKGKGKRGRLRKPKI